MSTAEPSVAVKPSLTFKRRLNAAPEKIYAAWTDPAKLVKWFGPEEIETLSAQADARVGGRFHIIMRDVERRGA